MAHLCDLFGTFEIESLSMLLKVTFEPSSVALVQLTGTSIAKARNVIGTKTLSLYRIIYMF